MRSAKRTYIIKIYQPRNIIRLTSRAIIYIYYILKPLNFIKSSKYQLDNRTAGPT